MIAPPRELEVLLSAPLVPQRAFGFRRDRWRAWVGHLDDVGPILDALPPALDRASAARLVDELVPGTVAGAFTVAMIWGHGSSGYGPYRVARVLTGKSSPVRATVSPAVLEQLATSVDIARSEGPVAGYRFLNNRPGHVAWLGPAFFTKWLYFVTAQGDAASKDAAPVLDALVIGWLDQVAGVRLRTGRTDDYARYYDLLRSWGAPHELAPVQVEEGIFRLLRNDNA